MATEWLEELRDCAGCPRNCHARRLDGELGYCRSSAGFSLGAICVHRGEEPVLGGDPRSPTSGAGRGICNVFFTRCNLQCGYCQNYQISRNRGEILEHVLQPDEVVARIGRILDGGTRHVGFVSPSHCIPQMKTIARALAARSPRPIFVMNTNSYDKVETLRSLEGLMDIYLPDLKYMDSALAARYSGAVDYPAVAAAALREMFRQKGSYLLLNANGCAESGLIVRHLVLPGHVENSKRCLRFIAEELSPAVHLSLLAQYQPIPEVAGDPDLGRRLRPEEYEEVLAEMRRLGFYRGWTQELDSAENYVPDFRKRHPFEA